MAFYDSLSLFYDSGVLYDAAALPQPTGGKNMAKVKLSLNRLTPDETVAVANQIVTAMTGNANFTTPNPTLATVTGLVTTAQTKIAAQLAAKTAAEAATTDSDAALTALRGTLAQLAAYVENAAGGDAVKIQSAGMSVRAAAAPIGVLGQVQNLAVTAGDDEGELDATWDPVNGAKSYQVQTSPDPITPTSWQDVAPVAKSRKGLSGLTSGARVWLRVRAISSKEENNGAWSDPAVKTVP
jgi:hypothetical protein